MLKRKSNPVDLPPQVYCSGGGYFFRHPSGWCQRLGSDAQGARALAAEIIAAQPVRRVVPALSCKPLRVNGPRWVFELPASGEPLRIQLEALSDFARAEIRRVWSRTIVRQVGVIRCINVRTEETAEWREQEEARRARQVVPRPPRTARTFGKKLRALVGTVDHERE